jgi:nucleotide-binding universal stress UspA family protein
MNKPIERIVVPLDGSAESAVALEAVEPLLEMHRPQVLLLGVMDHEDYNQRLRDHLDLQCAALRARGLKAFVALREGPKAAAEILEFARERSVDLIAMSTHGRGGLARMFVGSVTEEVLRHAPVPLLVCRPGMRGGDWKRILVALDGSERAEEILPEAAQMARARKVALDLVRVAIPIVTSSGVGEVPLIFPSEDPMPYLKKVSGHLLAEGVDARPVSLEGRAAAEILNYAKESKAGLLCMTTHGRTGAARLLLGSIAEEILRHAPCPVFLRRMTGAPKPVESA